VTEPSFSSYEDNPVVGRVGVDQDGGRWYQHGGRGAGWVRVPNSMLNPDQRYYEDHKPPATTGGNMAIPTTVDQVKANTNPAAVDGEDNLDRISAGLGQMGKTLTEAEEATDRLAGIAANLRAQATATLERAGNKASTATRQACDEAAATAAAIEASVRKVSELSAVCAESVDAADRGADPNRQQRDDAIATGADPAELFARAGDA
jgi:hypothetical protein